MALHASVMMFAVIAAKLHVFGHLSFGSFVALVVIGAVAYFVTVSVSMNFLGYQANGVLVEKLKEPTPEEDHDIPHPIQTVGDGR